MIFICIHETPVVENFKSKSEADLRFSWGEEVDSIFWVDKIDFPSSLKSLIKTF